VRVPEQATVYVNGYRTQSQGASRRYRLSQSAPGQVEVRAEITQSGKQIQQSKSVLMRAGVSSEVAFEFDNPETTLTVHVPQGATVFLAGREKPGSGTVRTFRTTKLAADAQWPEYNVRVSITQNGQQLSKDQTISIKSGEAKSLTFGFDEAALAVAD
jgi:uncharacterized protein (TIGR03000 family)